MAVPVAESVVARDRQARRPLPAPLLCGSIMLALIVMAAVLAAMDVRRHLRNLLMRNDIDIPVLSYQELAPEFSVQPLATVVLDPRGTRERAASGNIEQRMAPQSAR